MVNDKLMLMINLNKNKWIPDNYIYKIYYEKTFVYSIVEYTFLY